MNPTRAIWEDRCCDERWGPSVRLIGPDRVVPSDVLRPPSPLDLSASSYKDWLHLNVFVPDQGMVVVVNTSLHGDPVSPSSLGVGTVVLHRAGGAPSILATVDARSRHDRTVDVGPSTIAVGTTARVTLGDSGAFLGASVDTDDVELDVLAQSAALPIEVESPVPFGSGWISWRAVPRLDLAGRLRVGGRDVRLDRAIGYHDHNWGRWRWGDDIGWRWGAFPSTGDVTVTVAHRTDRRHRTGHPIARVQIGSQPRDFPPRTVQIHYSGRLDRPVRRLPGALAALRSDRRRPDLPERVSTVVHDGFDRLRIDFEVDEAVQLIASDPVRPGQTFIHELVGRFELGGRMFGREVSASGLGVFEHVD